MGDDDLLILTIYEPSNLSCRLSQIRYGSFLNPHLASMYVSDVEEALLTQLISLPNYFIK